MKIKFIQNTGGIGYAYMEGQEVDLQQALAKEMIELNYAVEINNLPEDLPENIPGRKILIDNGIETMAELRKITAPEQLMVLKGIGEKLAEQIIEFVK